MNCVDCHGGLPGGLFGIGCAANDPAAVEHSVACPSALIGASNFFALAVAAAISLYGFNSGRRCEVVGVLIEVPVMLLVVRVVNGSKGWYEQRA